MATTLPFGKPTPTFVISLSPCRLAPLELTHLKYLFHVYTPGGRLVSTFAPYEKMFTLPPLLPSEPLGKSTLRQDDNDAIERDLNTAREIKERAKMLKSTDSFVGLGIRTVKWSPSGEYLAIGGWDGKVRRTARYTADPRRFVYSAGLLGRPLLSCHILPRSRPARL